MEVGLDKRGHSRGGIGSGVLDGCADITQDRRVDTIVKASGTTVRNRADPVVADSLVGGENERVALTSD